MRPEPWLQLSSETVFEHKWYTVRRDACELPGGLVIDDYLVAVRPDYALVVAVTLADELVLVRQWKQGVREITLELPGGVVSAEAPGAGARRELAEETGYVAGELVSLGGGPVDPSKETNRVHYFLAIGAEPRAEQELDETEQIEVVLCPLAEVRERMRAGEIAAPSSVAGIYLALDALGRL